MSNPATPATPGWGAPQQWSALNSNHRQLTDHQPRSGTDCAPVGSSPGGMPPLFSPSGDAPPVETSARQNSSNKSQTGKENTPVAVTPQSPRTDEEPDSSTSMVEIYPPGRKPKRSPSSINGTVRQAETQPQPQPQPRAAPQPQQPQHEANPAPPQSSTPAVAKPRLTMKRLGGPFPFSTPRPAGSSKPSSPVTTALPTSHPGPGPGLGSRPDAGSMPQPNTKQTSASTSLKSENDSKQLLVGSSDDMNGLDENHPIVLVESDIDMADASASASASNSIRDSVSVSAAPTPSAVQTATFSKLPRREEAFDDKLYKFYKDENGEVISSQGALLPPEYQKCTNTTFPWICPVRSCRRMLPGLVGLGKHFCNSHRAVKLNDNMDGTLSDIGHWTDPTRGDGKANGGTAKPPLVVSRKPMSLEISPMVKPAVHANGRGPRESSDVETSISRPKRPSQPSRGGPRQSLGSVKAAALEDDSDDSGSLHSSDSDTGLERYYGNVILRDQDRKNSKTWTKFSDDSPFKDKAEKPISSDTGFTMANSERQYNQWPGKDGVLRDACGALLPDGYKEDTTMPDRPWICPFRSCRRLYARIKDLGTHFHKSHRGCLVNDNKDGTFSVLTQHDRMSSLAHADDPPRIISQDADNDEPLKNPQKPLYRTPTNIKWVDVFSEEVGVRSHRAPQSSVTPAVSLETVEEAAPVGVRNDNRPALTRATNQRLYCEWHGTDPYNENGEVISMAGALIPEGYKCDRTFFNRPWICPVRTCRITCKLKKGLGNHFTHSHAGQTLNDNGDGTFSIVGSYLGKDPKVVSKDPLAPDAPPIAEPQIPLSANLDPGEERLKALQADAAELASKAEAQVESPEPEAKSDPAGLWRYITENTGLSGPPPDHVGIRYLLKLPRVRDLVLNEEIPGALDTRQIGAILIYVTGKSHNRACTRCCRDGVVPFDDCVNTVWTESEGYRALYGSYIRSCANCLYNKRGNHCSVKAYIPAGLGIKPNKPNLGEDIGEGDYHFMENELKRRRSERLKSPSSKNANSNGINTPVNAAPDKASVDESLPAAKRPRRGLGLSEANGKAPELQRVLTIPDSASPSLLEVLDPSVMGEDVEMEEWEQGPGKVLTSAAAGRGKAGDSSSKELAFSSMHLLSAPSDSSQRQARTIQVAKGISFVATHIPSGTVHRFVPDETKLRMCTLANGKLRVTVDGEPEFAIGTHGVFKLSPGKGCRIVNRAYVDAVLHVTSVEGAE